jgi:hypothetical protein
MLTNRVFDSSRFTLHFPLEQQRWTARASRR